MTDLDAEHVYYDILKADYDEITTWARNAGHTDDEIRELHRVAARVRSKLGYNHGTAFHLVMLVAQRFKCTPQRKPNGLLTNLYRRFTIWLGRRSWWAAFLSWDHKRTTRKRKQWKFEAQDD